MLYGLAILFSVLVSAQVHALKLNPVVSAANTTDIHPNDSITVSWTKETGDPARFDIDLLWADGNLTTIAPDIDANLTKTLVKLGDIPAPGVYNIAVYVFGNAVVPKGPSFTVTPAGSSSSTGTTTSSTTGSAAASTSTTATDNTTSTSKKSNAGPIAGGVVGGVALLAIIAGLVFLLARRKKRAAPTPDSEISPFNGSGPSGDPEAGNVDASLLMQQNQLLNERIGALERALQDPTLVTTPPAYEPSTNGPTSPAPVTKSRIHHEGTQSAATDGS